MGNLKIFHNAKFYTMDKNKSIVDAIAVWDGKILSVGKHNEIIDNLKRLKNIFGEIESIDLSDLIVLPGLVDSHIHLASYADTIREIELFRCTSEEDVIKTLKNKTKNVKKGEWIIGRRWSQNDWTVPSTPSKNSIDAAFPDNPVLIGSKCGHIIWVNSLALKAANITKDTKSPDGGEIEFDKITNEPTGILKENAIYLVWEKVQRLSDEDQKLSLLKAIDELLKNGITTIHIPDDIRTFSLLQEIHKDNKLKIRIHFLPPQSQLNSLIDSKIKSGLGNEWISIGGLKLFSDGSLGGRTAYMLEGYEDNKSDYGICVTPEDELYEIASKANKNGISVAIHAIGDRAVRETINALRKVKDEGLTSNIFLPNRIEHFQCLHPDDLPKLKNADIVASVQPIHLMYDIRGKLLGKKRSICLCLQKHKRCRLHTHIRFRWTCRRYKSLRRDSISTIETG